MPKRRLLVIVAVTAICISPMAAGQDLPTSAPGWDPSEFQLGKDGPCSSELAEASALLNLRDSGQSRTNASAALPAENGASEAIAKSILDDIYENPAVAHFPYFVFRNITCMRRHFGKPAPATLAAVAPQVMACQRKFGVEASDHLIGCIQHAITNE